MSRWYSLRRLNARQERGAIAVVVVVLFASMVLFGAAALSVDLASMKNERQQLQNAADAVALSVAQDCMASTGCSSAPGPYEALADANARDDETQIARADGTPDGTSDKAICGTVSLLDECAGLTGAPSDCLVPSGGMPTKYVRVYTRTEEKSGSHILPYSFAQALDGQSDGIDIKACAQVGFVAGYDSTKVLPITQALCAWDSATNSGTDFPAKPNPQYSPPPTLTGTKPIVPVAGKYVTKVLAHDGPSDGTAKCGATGPGQYAPGNFGWLEQTGDKQNSCEGNLVNGTMQGEPGGSMTNGCKKVLKDRIGTIVYLPIFSTAAGSGQVTYTIEGVAAFYLAGFKTTGNGVGDNGYKPDVVVDGQQRACNSNDACLWGWFVDPLIKGGASLPGGDNFGPTTAALIG